MGPHLLRKGDAVGLARLILRSAIDGLFGGHRAQKRSGWCGGRGLEATGEGFEAIGLAPGRHHAPAAGLAGGQRRYSARRNKEP